MVYQKRAPFRANHVGSLLRPPELRQTRDKHEKGEISAAALREVEDRCIRDAVKMQEDIGMKGITDGEFRRTLWHADFLRRIEGSRSLKAYCPTRPSIFKTPTPTCSARRPNSSSPESSGMRMASKSTTSNFSLQSRSKLQSSAFHHHRWCISVPAAAVWIKKRILRWQNSSVILRLYFAKKLRNSPLRVAHT